MAKLTYATIARRDGLVEDGRENAGQVAPDEEGQWPIHHAPD